MNTMAHLVLALQSNLDFLEILLTHIYGYVILGQLNFYKILFQVFTAFFPLQIPLDSDGGNETLMSRMIGESLIPYDSDLFNYGIEQFSGNMDDVLQILKDKGVPVIIGDLTCNLKDQKPFVSSKDGKYPPADEVFLEANKEYAKWK